MCQRLAQTQQMELSVRRRVREDLTGDPHCGRCPHISRFPPSLWKREFCITSETLCGLCTTAYFGFRKRVPHTPHESPLEMATRSLASDRLSARACSTLCCYCVQSLAGVAQHNRDNLLMPCVTGNRIGFPAGQTLRQWGFALFFRSPAQYVTSSFASRVYLTVPTWWG